MWCKFCSRTYVDPEKEIKLIHDFCKNKEGVCLENIYKGAYFKYKCICKKGHNFKLKWSPARRLNCWCPICAGNKVNSEKEMKFIHKYCKNNNGICLENEYKGTKFKYKCKCKNNHEFILNWNNAKKRGDWCGECNNKKGEPLVGKALLEITGFKFEEQKRIKTLINPKTNRQLILDFVCFDPKIIVEYNGLQHYKIVKKFHRGKTEKEIEKKFEDQKYRDNVKKEWAKKNNYFFIEIVEIQCLDYNNVKNIVSKYLKKEYII